MVIPIDAVRCGMGFDERGRWHKENARQQRDSRQRGEGDLLAPARGMIYGLAASGVLWIGLLSAGKLLLRLR